jgi:hypothetical protein
MSRSYEVPFDEGRPCAGYIVFYWDQSDHWFVGDAEIVEQAEVLSRKGDHGKMSVGHVDHARQRNDERFRRSGISSDPAYQGGVIFWNNYSKSPF